MGEPTAAVMLGAELRRLRLERGMSLRKLVRILGLTAHSNLVQYEMGRRIPPGDIITAYERIFGDSAAALARLRDRVLAERAADPGRATVPVPAPDRAGSDPRHRTSPAMLPAAIAGFTGRSAQLRRLTELTATAQYTAVTIIAITGTAGVGKTALAVHFAHQIRDRFPDGQLHLNLRGYAPTPALQPVQALAT